MPKYLIVGSYTVEGAKGLLKDGGSKRRQVAEAALKGVGGKIEAFTSRSGSRISTSSWMRRTMCPLPRLRSRSAPAAASNRRSS